MAAKPNWLIHAFLCILCWGLWGFLAKLDSAAAEPLQVQILFTIGMLPVAIFAASQMKWNLRSDVRGATYGILNGVFTGAGLLAYYAAMQNGKASIVGPVTGLFPLLTVVLAFTVLHERLNAVQSAGLVLGLTAIALLSI